MIPVRTPLEGEILAPGDGARVIVRPSVLRDARVDVVVPSGLSIAEIVEVYARPHAPRGRLFVCVGGEPIASEWWPRLRVKSGAEIVIVGVPGRGAIRTVLAAVVAVVALVIAPYLAAPIIGALGLTAGGIAATAVVGLIGAGLTLVGTLAINALFPIAKPQIDQLTGTADSLARSPSFSIGGARNSARPYGAIPVVLGRHRQSPAFGAQPFTEFAGDDQFLRMLFVWGYGPIAVTDLKIGETPLSAFSDVQTETVQMLTDGATIGIYPAVTFEEQLQVGLTPVGAYSQRTTAANIDEFTADIVFPGGVYRFQRTDGRRVAYTVTVRIQYAVAGSGAWVNAGDITVTASTPDTIRRFLRLAVPRGQYDVRVAKISADYVGDDTVAENVAWTALRSRRNEAPITSDKPLTVTAIRIKATEELSGVIETLNGVCSGLVTAWNGTAWVAEQPSSNPADLFRHALQGNANARPVPDAQIDLDGLQAWHAYCVAQGFAFNQVRDFTSSVFETLRDIAAAGRAAVSLKDGKWSVVYDEGATAIVQHFTPRNSSNFSAVRAYADLPHAWRVKFINEDQGWLQDERLVYDDGYDASNATKFEGIDFAGVTDPDLIWRHGRYHIAQARLRRETYELDTDFEHLVATRGDRVRVQHDVTLWGLSAGRVKAVTIAPDTVTLDEPLAMEAGKTYTLRFRLADGDTLERTVAGVAGTFATVTLAGTDELPGVGDLFMAGEQGFESVVLRVLAVTPRPDLGARLILVDDAPGIATADQGAIPPFETGIANQIDFSALTVAPVSAVETLIEGVDSVRSRVRVTWTAPTRGSVAAYLVRHRLSGTTEWETTSAAGSSSAFDLFDLSAGLQEIQVKALFGNGSATGWSATTATVELAFAPPANVEGFRIAVNGDTATLSWEPSSEVLIAGYRIRFSPIINEEVTWSSAAPLLQTGRMATVQTAARVGTYLIRAVTYAGVLSPEPARIVSNIAGLTNFNVVENIQEHPAWAGARTGIGIDADNRLRLVSGDDVFAAEDWFGLADFFFQETGAVTSGVYLFANEVDLGDVYTSLVTVFVDAFGVNFIDDWFARDDAFTAEDWFGVEPSSWAAAVDVAVTQVDPALDDWSDWSEIGAANLTARAFKFRLRLATFDAAITPVVRTLSVEIDMPDRVVAGEDLVVTTAGRAISFAPPFRKLQGVAIAAQELETGDFYEITAKSETGFSIIFKNAGGSPVERTFDYVAKGYGATS